MRQQWPILLTSINFYRSTDYMPSNVWGEIIYPFPNFNCCTVEVWAWISSFTLNLTGHVISYPCWEFISKVVQIGWTKEWMKQWSDGRTRVFVNNHSCLVFQSAKHQKIQWYHTRNCAVCKPSTTKTVKLRIAGSLWEEPTDTSGFPSEKASNAVRVSRSLSHHNKEKDICAFPDSI